MLEVKEAIKVKGYKLANPDKIQRALHGSSNDTGQPVGGVMKSDGTFDDDELLAEYDRIGGLILKAGDKVRTGSFYDFTAKKPREKKKVDLEFRVNGDLIFVPEGKEKPGIVVAAQMAGVAKEEKKAKKAKKATKKAVKK